MILYGPYQGRYSRQTKLGHSGETTLSRDQQVSALIERRDNDRLQEAVCVNRNLEILNIPDIFTWLVGIAIYVIHPQMRETCRVICKRVKPEDRFPFGNFLKPSF